MARLRSRGSWPLAFGMFGMLPPYCGVDLPGGGGGGTGATGNVPSDAGASGAADAGAGGDGSVPLPDRVEEPLLGCDPGVSGKATPGTFEVLPPALGLEPPSVDYSWITDWSGDGRTAVGYYTTPSDGEAYGVIFIRWTSGVGYEVEARVRVEEAGFREAPLALSSCDGSSLALRLGQGDLDLGEIGPLEPVVEPHFHDYLTLSEDGSSATFLTGVRFITRPWTLWRSTRGDTASLLLDPVQSISWDGLTTFGTSGCYITQCTPPAVFRWRPGVDGGADVSTSAPTPIVAADGESIVYNFASRFIGIWREGGTQVLDCDEPCDAIAWSSRAQVLLVQTENGFLLWTNSHGFRPLDELVTLPAGWRIFPSQLSLDGWTISGVATTEDLTYPYFRATLNADAFE